MYQFKWLIASKLFSRIFIHKKKREHIEMLLIPYLN